MLINVAHSFNSLGTIMGWENFWKRILNFTHLCFQQDISAGYLLSQLMNNLLIKQEHRNRNTLSERICPDCDTQIQTDQCITISTKNCILDDLLISFHLWQFKLVLNFCNSSEVNFINFYGSKVHISREGHKKLKESPMFFDITKYVMSNTMAIFFSNFLAFSHYLNFGLADFSHRSCLYM